MLLELAEPYCTLLIVQESTLRIWRTKILLACRIHSKKIFKSCILRSSTGLG